MAVEDLRDREVGIPEAQIVPGDADGGDVIHVVSGIESLALP